MRYALLIGLTLVCGCGQDKPRSPLNQPDSEPVVQHASAKSAPVESAAGATEVNADPEPSHPTDSAEYTVVPISTRQPAIGLLGT